jgi:ribosome maturation factor RimP
MSGSSRHGSVRSPGSAASKPGTPDGRTAARPASGRPAAGRPASGQGKGSGDRRPPAARPLPAVDADRVAALAEPVIHALDLDLEGIRITAAGRRRVLRLVVDGDGGVSLDAIALASRELSAVLDDSEVMGEVPYTLEVSSPGVDRPLTERRHWRRAIGRLVTAPLASEAAAADPLATDPAGASEAGPAVIEGRVTGASADGITLDVAGESRQFGYGDLGPGRIKIEFARLADSEDDGDEAAEADELDELSADEEGLNGH